MPQPALEPGPRIGACEMNMTRLKPLPTALVALALVIAGAVLLAVQGSRAQPEPACSSRDFEGSRFIVCTYTAQRDELRLASRDRRGAPLRTFEALEAALGRDARRVRFAMNAGMFNAAGAPIGLYIADGVEHQPISLTDGPGNFHMKPNGVFWLAQDGGVHVDASHEFAAAAPQARWATQSGPMLLLNGAMHPRFSEDGASRLMRNGVGVRDNRTAYFVISSGFVSFGRFARFFRDELDCTNALFLDGSVSSLWAPELNRQDDDHRLGPMVVVLEGD